MLLKNVNKFSKLSIKVTRLSYLIFVFLLLPELCRAEDLSKESVGKILEGYMTVNLISSGVPFHDALAEVVKQDEPVSHLVIDVLTKYSDLTLAKPENLRILFLAMEGVGELTEKTPWPSKYFQLTITGPGGLERRNFLFLTSDCRRFRKILNSEGKDKAAEFGLSLVGDATVHAKEIPFDNW